MPNTYTPPVFTELEELVSLYSEMHKGVYGVRARWYNAETVEQARADIARLEVQAKEVWEDEERQRADAAVVVEQRIVELIKTGARDRATALRWLHDAEGTEGDNERLCYALGLEYGYFK